MLATTFCSVIVDAQTDEIDLFEISHIEMLSNSLDWHALMHYQKSSGDGVKSEVDSEEFFLSVDGEMNSHAELDANIKALLGGSSDSYVCQFPARARWISQSLGLRTPSFDNCHEYLAFIDIYRQVSGFSIVFADSFVSNPSSIFGHTFLKANFFGDKKSELLAPTFNYVAETEGVGSFEYVYKGLFGGFWGGFDQRPFFWRLKEYGSNQNRNLWEYPLKLDADEIEIVLAHLWEVRQHPFRYYYASENCGYVTLRMLAVAKPELRLSNNQKYFFTPLASIRHLGKYDLIDEPILWPSKRSQFAEQIKSLGRVDLKKIRELAFGRLDPRRLDDQERAALINSSVSYLDVLIADKRINAKLGRKNFHSLLQFVDEVPAVELMGDMARLNPQFEDDGRRATFGVGLDQDEYILGFRLLGRNRSDNEVASASAAEFELLNAELIFDSRAQQLQLQKVDLVRIGSYPPSTLLLANESWEFEIGAEREPRIVGQGSELVPQVGAGAGVTFGLNDDKLQWSLLLNSYGVERESSIDMEIGTGTKLHLRLNNFSIDLAASRRLSLFNGWDSVSSRAQIQYQLSRHVNFGIMSEWRKVEGNSIKNGFLVLNRSLH